MVKIETKRRGERKKEERNEKDLSGTREREQKVEGEGRGGGNVEKVRNGARKCGG